MRRANHNEKSKWKTTTAVDRTVGPWPVLEKNRSARVSTVFSRSERENVEGVAGSRRPVAGARGDARQQFSVCFGHPVVGFLLFRNVRGWIAISLAL